jgi:hypothetical protein
MQQYNSSRNSQKIGSGADVCQDFGLWVRVVYDFLVRIMVSLCELFWSFRGGFGLFLGDYLLIFSSHNGRRGIVDGY